MDIPYLDDELKQKIFDTDNCVDLIKKCSINKMNCNRAFAKWNLKKNMADGTGSAE